MKLPTGELFVTFFFLVGITLWGTAYSSYQRHQQVVKNGASAKGLVVGLHRVKRHGYSLAPSIRYQVYDGRELVFHSSEGQNPPVYQIGDEVTLYYNPLQPENVWLADNYLMVYVLAGIGALFLLVSVWEIRESTVIIWKWMDNS
ncbi:DUF3592 domain-containing protein [Spirosoma validum]|uniref:DUF3592 domain-containing protein n=1 Tax=Spirosoma validum TaxID=2771355 RepID=A0A927GGG0_9BACT|nr:DUF3592 domain-containing protein [Spirosoma validum]MBD2756836.1 DUF3592 domain-containing protein [Spirosoma validum]